MDNGFSSIRYILSVLFDIQMYLDGLNISSCVKLRKAVLSHCQMNENPCSNHEIHVLFEHGF